MSIKDTAPCNTDLLQVTKYILTFPRITSTVFFCQSVNIPGITSGTPVQNTPFKDLNIPGDKLLYDDFQMEFLIDEELQSWTSIYDWMRGIAFPHEFAEYKNLNHQTRYSENAPYPQYADAELKLLSTTNQPLVSFKFHDCFPIALSGFKMDIRLSADNVLTAISTFKYKTLSISRI